MDLECACGTPQQLFVRLCVLQGQKDHKGRFIKLAENRGGKIFERDLPASRKKPLYSENLPWATSPMQDEGTEIRRIFMPILCVDIAAVLQQGYTFSTAECFHS